MKFAVMSVPHTGTHFVLNLLGGKRDMLKEWMNKRFEANGHEFYVSHIYRLPIFEMMESEGFTFVVPMRHPMTTVRSWYDNYTKDPLPMPEDMSRCVPNIEKYFQASWVPQLYKSLIVSNQLYDLNFIPVDSPRREEYLQAFNDRYGLQLSTKWKPLNSHGKHTLDLPDDLRKTTEELVRDNPEFFGKFY